MSSVVYLIIHQFDRIWNLHIWALPLEFLPPFSDRPRLCFSESSNGVYILLISVSPRLISWGLHFIDFCLSPYSYHGVYILLISVSTPTHIMGSTFYLFLSSLKFNIPNLWRHILELLWNQTLVNGKLWLSEVFWSWIFGVIFCAARVNNKIHKSTPQLGNQSCRDLDHLGN